MTPKNTKVPPKGSTSAELAVPRPPVKVKNKSVLIVEDERPLAHALEMKLKSQGYQTHIAVNGEDALAELKKGGYHLMLLDLIMPVMDGFAVLEEMKGRKTRVPVIVLSNLGQDEDRTKAKELGAIDYFVKSNTPIAEIIARVQSVL
ncbi:MAG: response regulator [Candidatus Peribacteraceae bacterium]